VLIGEGARGILFQGNLLAANYDRNIRWKYDTRGEMVNNVVYGWGGASSWNTTNISDADNFDIGTQLDVIGNVYLAGPDGYAQAYAVYSTNTPAGTRLFMSDNIAPALTNVEAQYRASARVLSGPVPMRASDTYEAVLGKAGARPWDRDAVDKRIVSGVRARTLGIRDAVGTWPTLVVNRRPLSLFGDSLRLTSYCLSLSFNSCRGSATQQGGGAGASPPFFLKCVLLLQSCAFLVLACSSFTT
jgi:hypothetical protein